MKRLFLLYIFLLSAISVAAQSATQTEIDAKWFKSHYTKSEYMIPMRDGVKLYTAVYTPKNKKAEHPILLHRTPYGCAPYGKKRTEIWQYKILHNYMLADYILVFQDVRGRWMSEGEFVNIPPFIENKTSNTDIDEASDAYDTAQWLLRKVRNHNGRIGVYGNSYNGFYALMAAASGHPAIVAASPQAPIGDWFVGDDIHHDGALVALDAVSALSFLGSTLHREPSNNEPEIEPIMEGNSWDFFMNNTLADITRKVDGRSPLWQDIISHPNYDEWWQERDASRAAANVDAAILMVGGTFDAEDPYGVWNIYRELRAAKPSLDTRIVVGPWAHGAWRSNDDANSLGDVVFAEESLSEFYRNEVEFPFFEQHLRSQGDGGASAMGALVFFMGENCWCEMDAWQPENGPEHRLYLAENGSLLDYKPSIQGSYTSYSSDPNNPVPYHPDTASPRQNDYVVASQEFLSSRDDVLTFISPVLEQDVAMMGSVVADLYAAISSTDADFVVKVIDVGPNGESEMLVRGNIMRGRYRNSLSNPEPFVPNQVERVTFELPDVAHTFLAGHRIKVQVQSSWFPLFDRNPQQFIDIYNAEREDFIPCEIKIYHDSEYPSSIIFHTLR